jgi:hypothetical protein
MEEHILYSAEDGATNLRWRFNQSNENMFLHYLFISETQTKYKRKNEKNFARTKVMPHSNLVAILNRNRHFEWVRILFFHELWLTKCLTKIKRDNAKMLDFGGVMTKKSIFGNHSKFERHLKQSKIFTRTKIMPH